MESVPLIFHASIGYGHEKAAEILAEEVFLQTSQRPQIIDALTLISAWKRSLIHHSYQHMLQHVPFLWSALYRFTNEIGLRSFALTRTNKVLWSLRASFEINENTPFIVSTHPIITRVLAEWKEYYNLNVPLYHVCTDFGFHQIAIHKKVNGYFLSGLASSSQTVDRSYSYGIPVDIHRSLPPSKRRLRMEYGFSDKKPIIMIAGGGGGLAPYEEMICKLSKLPPMIIICMLGHKQQNIYQEKRNGHSVYYIPFTSNFTAYVHLADVLITKAGGLTLAHALTTETPLVLYKPLPGQEKENAILLEQKKAVSFAKTEEQLASFVERILTNSAIRSEQLRHAQQISKPHAAKQIIHQIALESFYYGHVLFSSLPASKSRAEY